MEDINNLEYLGLVIISIFCGLGIRISLSLAKQRWATTYHHTMSYIMLPPITMVITTLIAGNIALSLGMIGALSIVRFRNPVKNPFELIIFFALITIGIGVAVDAKLGVGLTVIIMLLIIIVRLLTEFFEKKGKKIFSLSFEEGNINHEINVKSKVKIDILDKNPNLSQFYLSKNPTQFNYNLIFSDKSELNNIKAKLEHLNEVEDIDIRYGS
ncbi:DUF4956 domain-containing protein [Pelagibacteraceae bacterium]|jgi:hypothetical protein|nr:DUF4956 domain-containing protein [Pelagibacteraceae bacterium]